MPELTGRLVTALALGGGARVLVATMDGPARELAFRHSLRGPSAKLAAEAMVVAALLSAQTKGEERVTVHVRGERPRFVADIDQYPEELEGRFPIRGRFEPAELPPTEAFRGLLAVIKSIGRQEVYRGVAAVEDETFEAALARYYRESVQLDAHIRVEAKMSPEGSLLRATGLLIERLPNLGPEAFKSALNPEILADLSELLISFAFGTLAGEPIDLLEFRELPFQCQCSRDRVLAMIQSLGSDEIQSLIDEQGKAEITCHFCNEIYEVDRQTLISLIPS